MRVRRRGVIGVRAHLTDRVRRERVITVQVACPRPASPLNHDLRSTTRPAK
jgi:hypothetical protein